MPSKTTTDRFTTEVLPILTGDKLYGMLLRLVRDPDAAEELVQRVSVRALRFRAHIERPDAKPKAWVFAIARHEVCDWWAERKRQDEGRARAALDPACSDATTTVGGRNVDDFDLEPECAATETPNIEGMLDDVLAWERASEAMAAMHPTYRVILERRYLAGDDTVEAAQAAGVRHGTAMSATLRGLDHLVSQEAAHRGRRLAQRIGIHQAQRGQVELPLF